MAQQDAASAPYVSSPPATTTSYPPHQRHAFSTSPASSSPNLSGDTLSSSLTFSPGLDTFLPTRSSPISNNLLPEGIDSLNPSHPLSDLRTPVTELPFPHLEYHTRRALHQCHQHHSHPHYLERSEEIYEDTSPIHEADDPVTAYVDGPVRQSIESDHWDIDREFKWAGYVQYVESGVRSSISREREARMKRRREHREGGGVAGEERGRRRDADRKMKRGRDSY